MSLFRRKSKSEAVDPEARSPRSGIKYKDLAVVTTLEQHGADLTQPRHVLYYLYFPNAELAAQAAEHARSRSFEVAVNQPLPERPNEWSLRCEGRGVVLDLETIIDNGNFFDDLAARFNGEYDGWEASVH